MQGGTKAGELVAGGAEGDREYLARKRKEWWTTTEQKRPSRRSRAARV